MFCLSAGGRRGGREEGNRFRVPASFGKDMGEGLCTPPGDEEKKENSILLG